MRLHRVGPVLLLAVLISCQLVICESDGDSATETIEICTKDVPDFKEIPVTTETNQPSTESLVNKEIQPASPTVTTTEVVTPSDPLTDVIAFEGSVLGYHKACSELIYNIFHSHSQKAMLTVSSMS